MTKKARLGGKPGPVHFVKRERDGAAAPDLQRGAMMALRPGTIAPRSCRCQGDVDFGPPLGACDAMNGATAMVASAHLPEACRGMEGAVWGSAPDRRALPSPGPRRLRRAGATQSRPRRRQRNLDAVLTSV